MYFIVQVHTIKGHVFFWQKNNTEFHGRQLRVEVARQRDSRPRAAPVQTSSSAPSTSQQSSPKSGGSAQTVINIFNK